MSYEVLIFPDGISEETGYYFPRWLLADLASREIDFINVVHEFSFNTRSDFGKSDFGKSLGIVTDLVLKTNGLYGTFRPSHPVKNIFGVLEKEGIVVSPKLAAGYIGNRRPSSQAFTAEVFDIERIVELKMVGLL